MKNDEKFQVMNHILSQGDLLLAIGIVAVLGGLIIPLPAFLIDVMLAFNIGLAMVIIMVATFVKKPLDFSVFPSVLLFTALLRIGMNVATTRKILLVGHAGEIIDAFGEFVVGGNYVVGAVIFIIIIVIQVMVIVAGSTRISEVAARFTLDAMPGKQMSIDADLNSGLITEDEARQKREDLSNEADFYGAMDGAAKFVRGDVTAGIIITVVNVIGGLILGIFLRDMSFQEALAKYTLLTIGDGLVAQVPSLVISVAAGIIVTRSSSSKDSLGSELMGQLLFHPKATAAGAITLFITGIIPSMPVIPFWLMGSILGGFSWHIHSRKKQYKLTEEKILSEEKKKPAGPEPVDDLLHVDIMALEIGYGLISLVDTAQGGNLLDRINGIRRQFALDLGLIVPPIRIRDNMQLLSNEYMIKIKGNEIAKGELMPEFYLAMNASGTDDKLVGIKTKEPAFGLPSTWVNETEKNRAESMGYTVVDATTVLATHLKEMVKKYGYELLIRQDVQAMVDNLKKRYPAVIEDIIPNRISIAQVHRILQNLLREHTSIRNLMSIFETIGDYASVIKDNEILTEYIRATLRMEISKSNAMEDGTLYIITLDPRLEKHLADSVHKSEMGTSIIIEPALKAEMLEHIASAITKATGSGISPVLLVSPTIRIYFRKLIEKELPTIAVLSYSEVSDNIKVSSIEMVTLSENNKLMKAGITS